MSIQVENTLETLALEDGVLRFKKDLKAKESNNLLNKAEVDVFNKAYLEALVIVEDLLLSTSKGGAIQPWREALKTLSNHQIAFIGLQALFSSTKTKTARQTCYVRIGLDLLLTAKLPVDNLELVAKLGAQVYHRLIDLSIFEEYQESVKDSFYLTLSDEAFEAIKDKLDWQTYMSPFWRPMVAKPRTVLEGSYLDSKLSKMNTLVNTFSTTQRSLLGLCSKPQTPFVKACDAIQEVPLKINGWILPIIKKSYDLGLSIGSVPTNVLPKGVNSKLRNLRTQIKSITASFLSDLAEAKHYLSYDEVYLPVTLDFRGRVYAKPYLNHQRADYVKAMWLFSNGKALDTPEAIDWLKIHIANTGDFDKMSKAPFKDRIQWVNDNFVRIYETVQDPFRDLWWTAADAPFSFLVACRELAGFVDVGADYVCHLPIAIDGSCSGLQHYSAMLRDTVGGKAVNLVSSDKPEDVYKDVANIVNQLVIQDQEDEPMAKEWLDHKIDRKVTKRATMTLCYGSKQYGWSDQLMEDFMSKYSSQVSLGLRDTHPFSEPAKASRYMAKKLNDALRMTVEKALEGMEWLQAVAGLLAKENKPVIWHSPLGFPVVNEYFTPVEVRLDLIVNKRRVRTKLHLGFTDKLKGSKQRSTIAPNFVHSYDATHLMMTVLQAKANSIHDFLLIHDSFGCLPSDMQRFSQVVKEEFVYLYSNNNPITGIYQYALSVLSEKGKKNLTAPPELGTLDINNVMQSNYAFA